MDVSFLLHKLDRKKCLGYFTWIIWTFISVSYYLTKKSTLCSKIIWNYDISFYKDGKISISFT